MSDNAESYVLHQVWAANITAPQLYEILRLRVEIFVVEQNCPFLELDGRDLESTTRHFWLESVEQKDTPLGCLRLLKESDSLFRIGRVCVAKQVRGQGLAKRLMEAALINVGDAECVLDAQVVAMGLYADLGFIAEGAEYLEDDISHVVMRRGPRVNVD